VFFCRFIVVFFRHFYAPLIDVFSTFWCFRYYTHLSLSASFMLVFFLETSPFSDTNAVQKRFQALGKFSTFRKTTANGSREIVTIHKERSVPFTRLRTPLSKPSPRVKD
jgi:hypothetical protein